MGSSPPPATPALTSSLASVSRRLHLCRHPYTQTCTEKQVQIIKSAFKEATHVYTHIFSIHGEGRGRGGRRKRRRKETNLTVPRKDSPPPCTPTLSQTKHIDLVQRQTSSVWRTWVWSLLPFVPGFGWRRERLLPDRLI